MTITPLTTKYLESIANLHIKVLNDTLNANIGKWFLEKLYHELLNNQPNSFCYIAIEQEQIVGFISGCFDYFALNKLIAKSITWPEKKLLAIFFIKHPSKIIEFVKQQFFTNYLARILPKPTPYILTLGVNSNQQGKGIAKQLMNQVKIELKNNNFYLDTKKNNIKAIKFYTKNDGKIIADNYGNVVFKFN